MMEKTDICALERMLSADLKHLSEVKQRIERIERAIRAFKIINNLVDMEGYVDMERFKLDIFNNIDNPDYIIETYFDKPTEQLKSIIIMAMFKCV